MKLARDAKPINLMAVADILKTAGHLDDIGGYAFLSDLIDTAIPEASIEYHAARIRELHALRLAQEAGEEIAAGVYGAESAASYLDAATSKLLAIQTAREKELESARDIIKRTMQQVETRWGTKSEIIGIPSLLTDLDKITAGLQKKDLIILAGRPSMGKTAEAMVWAEASANASNVTVIFSLEMGREQLTARLLSLVSGVSMTSLRNGKITEDDFGPLTRAAEHIANIPLFIDDSIASMFEIRSKCKRLEAIQGHIGMVIIDYLQLVSSDTRAQSREREVAEISRAGKLLAKELDCPVVMLSQLNRELEKRSDKRPIMSDLRESGAIEQDADVVIFVYRDEVYNKDTEDKGIMENIVAKQRNGPTGVARLQYNAPTGRISDLYYGYKGEI